MQSQSQEIDDFYAKVKPQIHDILTRTQNPFVHEPTLFGDNSDSNILLLDASHQIRQKQMKEGLVAQTIIGNFAGWEDLGIGHSSGLDCRKKDNTIIMDVKNKYTFEDLNPHKL